MAKTGKKSPTRLNLNLDESTHRLFKMATAKQGTDMTHAVLGFIDDYIRRHLPKEMWRDMAKRSG